MKIELKNISKVFGPVRANDGISTVFEEGRVYAILGENGAGKSTLMKILSGFQQPTTGTIFIDDVPASIATPNDAIAHGIGMLYQDPQDFAPLTVLENYMSGRVKGFLLPRQESQADLLQRCAELGFNLNPNALVESLTIGERQQLEIARLLSLGVQVLILDEPTTGISADQRTQLFETLKKLVRERNMSVILVSHKFRDVEELCDEVIVLRKGQLVGSEVLPCSTERLVEMMFGKRLDTTNVLPSAATNDTLLSVQNLSVHARLFSIDDISVDVNAGEVIGLAGLDGSGQVEFMRTLAGLGRPTWADHLISLGVLVGMWLLFGHLFQDSATVRWGLRLGLMILILAPLARDVNILQYLAKAVLAIGDGWPASVRQWAQGTLHTSKVIFEQTPMSGRGYRDWLARGLIFLPAGRLEEGLVSGLTVVQHFALATPNKRPWINWGEAYRNSNQAIEKFDIRGRPANRIQALSGGNQQRVVLSMLPPALKLILLENPTRGLDVESARRIWYLLLQRREERTAIIFSSPDLDEILDYSDRVLVFSSGQIMLVDDPSQMTTTRLGELIGGKF